MTVKMQQSYGAFKCVWKSLRKLGQVLEREYYNLTALRFIGRLVTGTSYETRKKQIYSGTYNLYIREFFYKWFKGFCKYV